MFTPFYRLILSRNSYTSTITRVYSISSASVSKIDSYNQVDYIKSIDDTTASNLDWLSVKNNILSMRGNLNKKNVDAVLLKVLVSSKNLIAASLFAQHLKSRHEELNLGSINSMLYMYSTIAKQRELTSEEKKFVLDTHKILYEKYKVLDSSTSEQLLQVLCGINEWEKALLVLEEIHLSAVPTHLAYSTMIATFFRLNKKKKALALIEQSIKYKRPLQHIAYEEWMKYIVRKYKDKKTIAKYLDEILKHIGTNWAVITESTAKQLRDLYISLDWESQFARIRKSDGQCSSCKDSLDRLTLSDEEFRTLQQNIKEKLIIGSDLLLKTTHDELKRFLESVERFAPYDVVLDGLNICYAANRGPHIDKLLLLENVVDYFVKKNKKILLLGRQHMLRWNKKTMDRIKFKTCSFLTDNLSQDDPFFITAAILSGPHTDIVSKDLLRGHKFNLKDDTLKQLFKRWQWQHQWMIFSTYQKGLIIQPPLQFTPCAQKQGTTWHIPFESETVAATAVVINLWLIMPPQVKSNSKQGKKGSKTEVSSNAPKPNQARSHNDIPTNARLRRNLERVEMLARPTSRRLRSLWDEKCAILPREKRDKIKSALEEDYFLSPEQTEQYFQAMQDPSRRWSGPAGLLNKKESPDKSKELRQRQKWLVNFSAQVAYRLCDYIAKGQKEMLVSNRLRSIADVVLERVAEILGEPKPTRTNPGRLPRFMVAISDRIAVWIENAVYRADAIEPLEAGGDEHMRLDAEKPFV
ncbi:unnamed protein product [Arctia plantaginis]|uniref:Mitochondrial ribonuclease P catalytic subunit n=1 Tax=Arctia plantaginis TaxID=874455 RepID=A0A8S1AAT0_ARCPL|nr:unnamed protein product [Arctia plantaginis]